MWDIRVSRPWSSERILAFVWDCGLGWNERGELTGIYWARGADAPRQQWSGQTGYSGRGTRNAH